MHPAFVAHTPLNASRQAGPAQRATCARSVRMAAEGGEKKSLGDWLLSKIMHNNEEVYGYEPFLKQAMDARDEEKSKVYAEKDAIKKKD